MNDSQATAWALAHLQEPIHLDCVTALMLKILDGKCKMAEQEKQVIAILYGATKHRPGKLLGQEARDMIAAACGCDDDVMAIYEQRLLAETMISRPVMKGFKAMLREHGVLTSHADPA